MIRIYTISSCADELPMKSTEQHEPQKDLLQSQHKDNTFKRPKLRRQRDNNTFNYLNFVSCQTKPFQKNFSLIQNYLFWLCATDPTNLDLCIYGKQVPILGKTFPASTTTVCYNFSSQEQIIHFLGYFFLEPHWIKSVVLKPADEDQIGFLVCYYCFNKQNFEVLIPATEKRSWTSTIAF